MSRPERRTGPRWRRLNSTSSCGRGLRPGPGRFDEAGSVSLELVILVPALVLLTLFVLWAGRGGQAGLTADLAAEEAATAAALCCEEGEQFQEDRDALVADILAARPGLQFLCIGGLQPAADPDRQGSTDPEFVQENWLEFEPAAGVSSGGVGVLGVRFTCETDGAVAPLRGLFPTVTFHGQASEVVVRQPPPPDIGFKSTRFTATEGTGNQLVFTVTSLNPVPQDVVVRYQVDAARTNAFSVSCSTTPTPDTCDYLSLGSSPLEVTIPNGADEVDIVVTLENDSRYEGRETLVLELLGLYDTGGNWLDPAVSGNPKLDTNRVTAEGWIDDDDAKPYLFIVPITKSPCEVVEDDTTLDFEVRLRDVNGIASAPSATTVTVDVATVDVDTNKPPGSSDYTPLSPNPTSVTINPGVTSATVRVDILDDISAPVAEPDETFKLELSSPTGGVTLGSPAEVTCKIIDDEVRVTVANASADEGNDIEFKLMLDRTPTAAFDVEYKLIPYTLARPDERAIAGTTSCTGSVDYYGPSSGQITVPSNYSSPLTLTRVQTCQDNLVEHDETFWLELSIVYPRGGGGVPAEGRDRHDPERRRPGHLGLAGERPEHRGQHRPAHRHSRRRQRRSVATRQQHHRRLRLRRHRHGRGHRPRPGPGRCRLLGDPRRRVAPAVGDAHLHRRRADKPATLRRGTRSRLSQGAH